MLLFLLVLFVGHLCCHSHNYVLFLTKQIFLGKWCAVKKKKKFFLSFTIIVLVLYSTIIKIKIMRDIVVAFL